MCHFGTLVKIPMCHLRLLCAMARDLAQKKVAVVCAAGFFRSDQTKNRTSGTKTAKWQKIPTENRCSYETALTPADAGPSQDRASLAVIKER